MTTGPAACARDRPPSLTPQRAHVGVTPAGPCGHGGACCHSATPGATAARSTLPFVRIKGDGVYDTYGYERGRVRDGTIVDDYGHQKARIRSDGRVVDLYGHEFGRVREDRMYDCYGHDLKPEAIFG